MISPLAVASDETEAVKTAGEALVKQLGIDKMLKRASKKYIPDIIRENSAIVIVANKAVQEEKINWVWEWRF